MGFNNTYKHTLLLNKFNHFNELLPPYKNVPLILHRFNVLLKWDILSWTKWENAPKRCSFSKKKTWVQKSTQIKSIVCILWAGMEKELGKYGGLVKKKNHLFIAMGMQHTAYNIQVTLLCFVLLWLHYSSGWIHMNHLVIFFMVTSLALGQSYDCPNASDAILQYMGKIGCYITTMKNETLCA